MVENKIPGDELSLTKIILLPTKNFKLLQMGEASEPRLNTAISFRNAETQEAISTTKWYLFISYSQEGPATKDGVCKAYRVSLELQHD